MNLYDITKKYILNDIELVIIETIINELSKGNQKISIRDIASQTYVSTTMIVKLAKKLGFVGYSQMIYLLNESIHQKVSIENLSHLSEFVNNADIDKVQKLIDDIYQHKHEKIYLVGVGFSDIITHYFLKRLASFDIFAYDGAPIDCISARSKPSITIIFSKSGETADLIQIIKLSKKMGHTIYSITTSRQSTIAQLSDYHIELEYKRNKFFDTPDYYVGTGIFVVENILAEVMKKEEG
jgi:Transcriptional regulators